MTRRTKIITLVVLIVVALLLLLWLLLDLRKAITPEPTPEPTTTLPVPNEVIPTVQEPDPQIEERATTSSVQSLSKTFTERYGSYSTEANYANLEDVLPLMTERFAAETRQFIATAPTPTTYYGVTTHVISLNVDAIDEVVGTATVTVQTQREEANGSVQNVSVRYQALVLVMEKIGPTWYVDSATWQ